MALRSIFIRVPLSVRLEINGQNIADIMLDIVQLGRTAFYRRNVLRAN